MKKDKDVFSTFTSKASLILGRAWVFIVALIVLIVWAISGPVVGFSDTWQLVINTGTTIITFLMVFIIQNTQNRDNMATNIKQDAIMRKLGITEKDLIEAEDKSDHKLEREKDKVQQRSEKNGRQ
jgi:low affinity Fe/Cu permease